MISLIFGYISLLYLALVAVSAVHEFFAARGVARHKFVWTRRVTVRVGGSVFILVGGYWLSDTSFPGAHTVSFPEVVSSFPFDSFEVAAVRTKPRQR